MKGSRVFRGEIYCLVGWDRKKGGGGGGGWIGGVVWCGVVEKVDKMPCHARVTSRAIRVNRHRWGFLPLIHPGEGCVCSV